MSFFGIREKRGRFRNQGQREETFRNREKGHLETGKRGTNLRAGKKGYESGEKRDTYESDARAGGSAFYFPRISGDILYSNMREERGVGGGLFKRK